MVVQPVRLAVPHHGCYGLAAAAFFHVQGLADQNRTGPSFDGIRLSLDSKTIRSISHLARLRLAEDQLETMARELGAILGWIEQLGEVDTEGVAPMTGVGTLRLPLRLDAVTDGGNPDAVLANAPGGIEDCFAVPKVVE